MRRAVALIGIAAVVAGTTYVVRGVVTSPEGEVSPTTPAARDRLAAEQAAAGSGAVTVPGGVARNEVDRLIAVYEEQVRRQPSALDYTFLGQLYLQRARLTGDVSTYGRAEEALTRALEINPLDPEARSLLASVRFTVHDFTGARTLAEELLAEDPSNVAALAVSGDARLELGDYPGATAAYDELGRRLPGAAAVGVRRARLSYLLGDAGEALRLAAQAEATARQAGLSGADLAWYRSFRAQLELETGSYATAAELYLTAVRMAPRYHVPQAGLGRALAAAGRMEEAITHYRRAIELLPDPAYLSALGDLYAERGDDVLARRQYETVEAIATLAEVNEQVYNRQLALFYADHDVEIDAAVALASRELEVRRDVYGWDVYAWALYRAGRLDEAREAADRALRLGTPDPRLLYHAGMISLSLGDLDQARVELETALRIGPAFDPLQVDVARDALRSLQ